MAYVAERCGLSKTHLAEVELENRMPPRPSHPAYAALAELFGVSVMGLRLEARRERTATLVEGVTWRCFRQQAAAR